MSNKDSEVQVSTLIYAMGCENVFKSFIFGEEEEEDDYDTVLAKFDAYFILKTYTTHERACFHQRVQKPGEKAELFIRALYELSENYDFGDKRSEHIRDRLIVGIRDRDLSQRLQLMSDLTLETATQMVRQAEDVAQQMFQQERRTPLDMQEVTHRRPLKRGRRQPFQKSATRREPAQ